MFPNLILDMFFVYHVRLGVVPFFGNGNLLQKKLGPKNFFRDKFGYNRPVSSTHGDHEMGINFCARTIANG